MINIFKGTRWWTIMPAVIILIIFFLSIILFGSKSDYSKIKVNTIMKNGIQRTCDQLNEYYSENGVFPTSLSMLDTKFPENQKDYSYAYYPEENPTSYHIGVTLRYEDNVSLNNDADFDSKEAGYINGFDGRGQVFDIHIEN